MNVEVELSTGERIEYQNVIRIDDQSDSYKIKIYGETTLLAALSHSDIRNLITRPDSTP